MAARLPPPPVISAALRTLRRIQIAGGRMTNALLQNWPDYLRIWLAFQRYIFLSHHNPVIDFV